MNKILSLFLLLIFISGCIPSLKESEIMVKEGVHKLKAELQKSLGIDEYAMQVGDSVTIDNKIVILEIFNSDYVVVFDVDGAKIEIKETNDPQIINDLELTILWRKFDTGNMANNHVKVRVVRYVPEEDQYLFYPAFDDVQEILGHSIKVNKLEKDGTVLVRIDMTNELRIMKDRSEAVANLYISNVRPVYRAIASERHVILKIVEKP